jgi:hypothetical protein
VAEMISNFRNGMMSGYTVYKTDNTGTVSIDVPKAQAADSGITRDGIENPMRDSFEPTSRLQGREKPAGRGENELQGIKKMLEEINAKLAALPELQMNTALARNPSMPQRSQDRGLDPSHIHPMMREDIPAYSQHYDLKRTLDHHPSTSMSQDGSYGKFEAFKSLQSWTKTEYAQTEGLNSIYSPQELRDRMAILGEIENTIKGGMHRPPVQKRNQYGEGLTSYLKTVEKDPDRIARSFYFETMI